MIGEENEKRDAYREAFDEVWRERSKERETCPAESTVKGPLGMAGIITDAYFEGLEA